MALCDERKKLKGNAVDFRSDNTSPVHPKIMDAILEVNIGNHPSYGKDNWSLELSHRFSEIFDREVIVYLTSTGTAANALALSAMTPEHGVVFCHESAHINTDEANAPEFFTGGAKLSALPGHHGKIDIEVMEKRIEHLKSLRPHMPMPSCISISQATEVGTVYSLDETRILTDIAKENGLHVHMDGARFANALVHLGCSPSEMTWRAGVEVVSFGGTKNGAMMAEAIIFFNKDLALAFDYRHKRAGQLSSKNRYLAAQFLAYLEDDLWMRNALHANDMATRLSEILIRFDGVEIAYPVQGNEVFAKIPTSVADFMIKRGVGFYEWDLPGENMYRFVTSWATTEDNLGKLENLMKEIAGTDSSLIPDIGRESPW